MHNCSVVPAGQAEALVAATPAGALSPGATHAAPTEHCSHHSADSSHPAKTTVSCSDFGRPGPDLRPAFGVDAVVAQPGFDPGWQDFVLRPVSLFGGDRPLDDGHGRLRPLHLQKSVLLI